MQERTQQQRYQKLFWGSVAGNVVALVLAVVALVFALMGSPIKQHIDLDTRDQPSSAREVSRVAFGSCSAYDVRPQPIWENVSFAQCFGQPDKMPGEIKHWRRIIYAACLGWLQQLAGAGARDWVVEALPSYITGPPLNICIQLQSS
eukprot:605349-Pelagomonas_calceolata.AAC.1